MRTFHFFAICALVLIKPIFAQAQLQLGPTVGVAYNDLFFNDSEGNSSSNLYGPAVGFTIGVRARYPLVNRLTLGGELSYQSLPYTNKFLTGAFYPGYITLSAAPAFQVTPWLEVEGGAGTGFTVVSRFENELKNDPLFLGLLGLRFPLKNWDLNLRYYRFIRPLHKEITGRSERKYYSEGFQAGVTYYLLW